MIGRERKRERERDRQTDRQRDRGLVEHCKARVKTNIAVIL